MRVITDYSEVAMEAVEILRQAMIIALSSLDKLADPDKDVSSSAKMDIGDVINAARSVLKASA